MLIPHGLKHYFLLMSNFAKAADEGSFEYISETLHALEKAAQAHRAAAIVTCIA